ncbi:MAG TPA: hypothetical protein VM290_02185 [Gaiellaceae bacterium]|nr:hypothetical protein [Gaiellaceae bacterium]
MRALIVGPGRIGCGYLAPLFARAGWDVVLAARSGDVAARIRRAGGFRVRTTRPRAHEQVAVAGAVAVGTPDFARELERADLLCTAVGVGNVTRLAPDVAAGLAGRTRPLDVWTVENADCAPAFAARLEEEAALLGLLLPEVAVAGGVATVAVAHGSWHDDDEPEFVGDGARTLWVDETRLPRGVPDLPGVRPTRHYLARLREKLFVFNAGHAICGYLGWLRGHETVADAVADPYLRPMVAGCLLESRRALVAAYPELGDDVAATVADALERFADEELADPVVRVARDPLRKLAPRDRLLGPVALIHAASGRVPPYFALGVAGALLYRGEGDRQGEELAERLQRDGAVATVRRICGLPDDDAFARSVVARYRGFILAPDETIFPPVHAGGAAP